MKSVIVSLFGLAAIWIGAQAQQGGYYDSRYDYVDVDVILDSKRLVRNYVDCLLNVKPCTAEGKALRRILPEGLRTKCARCSPRQKHNALLVLKRLRAEHPHEWSRLVARWDPTGDLTRRFEEYLESEESNRITGNDKPLQPMASMSPRPAVLNRFGDEEQPAPSEMKPTIRAVPNTSMRMTMEPTTPTYTTARTTRRPSTLKPEQYTMKPVKTTKNPEYPTLPPPPPPIKVDLAPIYAGTMGLIDHFGNKIIRTTELVTDLLKNTVRVVTGGK